MKNKIKIPLDTSVYAPSDIGLVVDRKRIEYTVHAIDYMDKTVTLKRLEDQKDTKEQSNGNK